MPWSLPDGVTWRPLTRDDAALVAEVLAEEERAFGRESRLGADDVLAWWLRTDLEADSWLLEEDGRPVALGWLEVSGELAQGGSAVRGRDRGRGLGAAMVERAEELARVRGVSRVFQHALAEDGAAHALLRSFGYREARRYWEMAIELEAPPQALGELPEGLLLDTFRTEDAREFHDAIREAFADEWGFVSLPFDEWWASRWDDDHSLWFVVRDGERIAAYARCESRRSGSGFVGMLGVRHAYRRRGLGLALLRHTFDEFWRRGVTRVTLGVDSANPTGATRLYERAGMHVVSEDVTFEKGIG